MSHLSGLLATVNWHWVWLVVAAFLAGVLNAVAGGGSFLLFPAMLNMGILPVKANATNTVAIWPGQLTSIAGYRDGVRKNLRLAWLMGLAGLTGGTIGAVVLLNTPQKTFMHLVPWLLLAAALIFAVSGPVTRWLARLSLTRLASASAGSDHPQRVPIFIATVLICFYIGYFGAGAGFLIMTVLSLFGFQDLHDINSMKVVASTAANGMAFIIFIVDGQVEWRYCLLAMIVGAIGGYYSASLAKLVPQSFLRTLVVIIGLSMAAWYFWTNP
jgi:uncharacterized membrane protein YfcA